MPLDTMTTTGGDLMLRYFVNGKLAMRIGAASDILSIQRVEGMRFEAWSMPGRKNNKATVFKSNVVGIASGTKNAEEAWAFLNFLRGTEGKGEELYMKAKRTPPSIDDSRYWALYADPAKYPKLIERNSKDIALNYGHKLPLRPGWLEVEQALMPSVVRVMLGEMTAADAMKAVAPRVQAILDRTGKK
jgi:ABC-type glycerol-3-phosphate transport system substrate-binding protein